jgi:predicted DNA-binding transcriptional regulator AlpA
MGSRDTTDLIRDHEVARLFDVSVAAVRRWRQAGHGPRFLKLGRCVRYRRRDVLEFLRLAKSEGPGPIDQKILDRVASIIARLEVVHGNMVKSHD